MMRRFWVAVAVLGVLAIAAVAYADLTTATVTLKDGKTLVLNADSIENLYSPRTVVTGRPAHVKVFDPAKKSEMDTCASKIIVTLSGSGKSEVKAASSIKSADLTGSPQIIYKAPDNKTGDQTITTVTGTHAVYDGEKDTVTLQGNVKIISDNPAIFQAPAVMTGDEAIVYLSKDLGPDDVRYKIWSSPGVSSITATPKAKEETKTN
jgi:Tfp pilus assembly protein PilE